MVRITSSEVAVGFKQIEIYGCVNGNVDGHFFSHKLWETSLGNDQAIESVAVSYEAVTVTQLADSKVVTDGKGSGAFLNSSHS